MKDYEQLRAAADLLVTDGWCQDVFQSVSKQFCAVGAIKAATPDPLEAIDAEIVLAQHLGNLPDISVPRWKNLVSVTLWNDEPGRTAGEVIQAMRDAADWAEKQAAERGDLGA